MCIIDNWVYVHISDMKLRNFSTMRYFWIVLHERKSYVLIFIFSHTHRDQVREEKDERRKQPGGEKKKKILTIVKSLLSIKFWSLSIKDPTTGRNRTSAGEMDVFKKRGIPFKLHLLQDEERDVDILRKLKNWRIDVSSSTTRRWKYLPSSSLVGYSKNNFVSFNKNNSVAFLRHTRQTAPRKPFSFPLEERNRARRTNEFSVTAPWLDPHSFVNLAI